MRRVYFCCPISDFRDDLVIEGVGYHYDNKYISKLLEVTSSNDCVLYVTEDWMHIPDSDDDGDNVDFRVLPLDYHFCVSRSCNIGYCGLLFPDHVEKHPVAHISSCSPYYDGGTTIEIHFDVDEDV